MPLQLIGLSSGTIIITRFILNIDVSWLGSTVRDGIGGTIRNNTAYSGKVMSQIQVKHLVKVMMVV
jgi:hypothetical protein